MDKETIDKLICKAEELDWNVEVEDKNDDKPVYCFSKYSPAGQDFRFSVQSGGDEDYLIKNILCYYDNFDCSMEAYLWLDDCGHGVNGAPYDMKDVYEDMEACQEMVHDLYLALYEVVYE